MMRGARSEKMIELRDIGWTAPNGKEVLKRIDLVIPDDRLVAITGPNGSGKTTLARILMGLEKPSRGKIIFDGEDITSLDVTERAKRGISFAFQQPVRFKGITVKKMLETASGRSLGRKGVCNFLQKVGLCGKDYQDRDIDSTLSGGEIKRIEIATVLARSSKLSIFDEPEAGIDIWSFQNLISTFDEMRRDLKGTLVIISHQERILKIADEIALILGGTVAERGPGPEMVAKMLAAGQMPANCCSGKE